MKKFILTLFGNFNKGQFNHSFKKTFFLMAVVMAFIGPHVLLIFNKITGSELLDYYIWILGIAGTVYSGGKFVDYKINGTGSENNLTE